MSDEHPDVTFWGWVTGPHPKIEAAVIYGFIFGLLSVIYIYLGWVAAALFAGSLFSFFIILKHLLSLTESNLLLVLDPDKPSTVGVHLLGPAKWRELVLVKGDIVPFVTSEGTHAVFCTSYDGTNITASWIHQIGRTEFLSKSATYEKALTIAEDCYKQLTLIKDIPRLMGVSMAGTAINVYEGAKIRDISTLDPTDDDREILEILRKLRDPLDIIIKKDPEEKIGGLQND